MDRPFAHHVQSSLTSVQRARLNLAPNVGSGLPGPDAPPWYCAGGALAGKYLKADVEEVQKPDMTRKVSSNLTRTGGGSRDARPLAPPPIVRVRIWECKENGERIREVDMKADAPIHSVEPGLLCNAILFPYNHAYDTDPSIPPHDHPGPSPILPATAPPHPYLARESTPVPPTLPRRPNRELPDGLSMRDDLEGCRDKQCKIIQAFREDEGAQAAYFVFDDLKVKERGHFLLRYTVLWLDPAFNGPYQTLGYTFGGVFAVFPSKKCPPVPHSTDLFMHLYRLNVVKHPKTSATTRAKKRKREDSVEPEVEPDNDEDEEDDEVRQPLSGAALLPSTSAGGSGQAPGSGNVLRRNASPPSPSDPPRLVPAYASHHNHPLPLPPPPPTMPAHLRLPWAPAPGPLTFALQHPPHPRSPASASSSASSASPPPGSTYAASPTAGPASHASFGPASPASASYGAPSPVMAVRYNAASSSPHAPAHAPSSFIYGPNSPRTTSSAPVRTTLHRGVPLTAAFASPSPTPVPVPPPPISVHTARPSPTSSSASAPAPSSYPPTRRRLPFDPVYDA